MTDIEKVARERESRCTQSAGCVMDFESDDECTADYGVFGDRACGCAICNPPPQKRDLHREQQAARWKKRREQERQTSSNFNLHMIALFNAAQRKEPT